MYTLHNIMLTMSNITILHCASKKVHPFTLVMTFLKVKQFKQYLAETAERIWNKSTMAFF